MAVTSSDDVEDGDTTAAGLAPAASAADEEDRTVQQAPDSKFKNAVRDAQQQQRAEQARPARTGVPAVAVPSAVPGAKSMSVTSKRMTVVGLAPPAAASAPGATGPASRAPATQASPSASITAKKTPAAPATPASAAPRPGALPSAKVATGKPVVKPTEAEEEDASITATAPAPRVPPNTKSPISKGPLLPLTVPGQVQIREMPPPITTVAKVDPLEESDETEIRTVITAPPDAGGAAKISTARKVPAAAAADDDDEELEDSVTTQAPSAVKGGRLPEEDVDEPKTSPPLRLPPPIPAAGRSPFDEPPIRSPGLPAEDDDAYNAEESVTTRGPAVPDFRLDDSVTADSPVADPPDSSGRWPSPVSTQRGGPPALPPNMEDPTNPANRLQPNKRPAPRPAAGTLASLAQTTPSAALRVVGGPSALASPPVIAASVTDDDIADDDDDEPDGTAVMVGAPVKPLGGPATMASRAARTALVGHGGGAGARGAHATALSAGVAPPQPSSDSGLRVAPYEQQPYEQPQPVVSDRGSGVAQREYPSQPLLPLPPQMHFPQSEPSMALSLGATIPANHPMLHQQQQQQHGHPHPGMNPGQMQQYDFAGPMKKPRYGLLVGLVALLSFAIPLVLFLWLQQSAPPDSHVRAPAEAAPDTVGPDKAIHTKAPAAASSSAHAPLPPPKPTGRGPIRR